MRRFILVLSLACASAAMVLSTPALAGSGGSSYSVLGIGDLRYLPGARAAGMGYAGIAVPTVNTINIMSPGTWSGLLRVRAEGMLLYEGFDAANSTASRSLANADFAGALIGIPISTSHGVTLVASFVPYSNVNYTTFGSGTYISPVDTATYRLQNVGTGGVNRAVLGLSYRPLPALSVGAGLNYLFGSINRTLTQTITGGSFSGGSVVTTQTFKGATVSVGAVYNGFGTIAEPLQPLTLGGFIISRGSISTSEQQAFGYGSSSSGTPALEDTTLESGTTLVTPFSFGLGLSYQLNERTVVAADFISEPWRQTEYRGSSVAGIRSASRWSVGFEYAGSREGSWLERTALRLGFTYHPTYFRPSGEPITEWGVTAGLGFPLGGDNRLNIAGEYGGRGTTAKSLIKEKIFRITVALSIGETWFQRPEED